LGSRHQRAPGQQAALGVETGADLSVRPLLKRKKKEEEQWTARYRRSDDDQI
jgi:hypothetical protein